ncbi:hypothetical protein ES703_87482 [subsurface metagenome]
MQLLRRHVPVDVACDPHPGVPQYAGHYLHLRAVPEHMGGVGVPQLVRGERPDPGPQARPPQRLLQVVDVHVAGAGVSGEEVGGAAFTLSHVAL